jgi:hypothetical protein
MSYVTYPVRERVKALVSLDSLICIICRQRVFCKPVLMIVINVLRSRLPSILISRVILDTMELFSV